jgi:hypothetical protein
MKLNSLNLKKYREDIHGIQPEEYPRLGRLICLVGKSRLS